MAEQTLQDKVRLAEEEAEMVGGPFETLQQMQSEVAPMFGEVLGATAGAGLGATVAGPGGAMIGGAAGARMGRAGGIALAGREEREGELTGAAISGMVGPVANQIAKFGIRLFTGIPSLRRARALDRLRMDRAEATAAHSSIQRVADRFSARANRALFEIDKQINTILEMSPADRVARFGTMTAANQRLQELNLQLSKEAVERYRNLIPESMKKAFMQPESISRRAGQVLQLPEDYPGTTTGAVSLLMTQSLTGGAIGGIVGWLLGKAGRKVAPTLVKSDAFRRWVMNVPPASPLGQAALSFIGEVILQSQSQAEAKVAKEFYDEMISVMEEIPELAFETIDVPLSREVAGSTALQLSEQGRQQLQQPQTSEFTPRGSGPRIGINLQ